MKKNHKRYRITLKILCAECNSELENIRLDFDMLALTCIVSGECIVCKKVNGTLIDVDTLTELSSSFWRKFDNIDPAEEEEDE